MEKIFLKDACEIIFSGGTPERKIPEYWNGDVPWLSSGETDNDFIIETEEKITELGLENKVMPMAKVSDVVMASAGQGILRYPLMLSITFKP